MAPEERRSPAKPVVVGGRRPRPDRPSLAVPDAGIPRGVLPGPARHRDPEQLERGRRLQRPSPRPRRARQARGAARRRVPGRGPGHLARRADHQTDRDALPEPDGDGRRGADPGNPLDGVVLLAGCDKTIPASLMGAASVDVPAADGDRRPDAQRPVPERARRRLHDCWRLHDELRADRISQADWDEFESGMCRSDGHCSPMGTASTMACLTEALGMAPSGSAAIPAVDSRRRHVAERAGSQIIDLVAAGTRPSDIMTRAAFENAIRTLHAIGGSTNAVIHLVAIAGRLGVDLPIDLFDELAATTPLLVNIKPSGAYLMEDFYYAGGLPAVHAADDGPAPPGRPDGHRPDDRRGDPRRVDRQRRRDPAARPRPPVGRQPRDPAGQPLPRRRGAQGLRGQQPAAPARGTRRRLPRCERAPRDDRRSGARDPARRRPRPPERRAGRRAGHARVRPPPDAVLPAPPGRHRHGPDQRRADERHRLRHVVLHVAPESAIGGPLALVQTGDRIRLDTAGRRLDLLVGEEPPAARRRAWKPRPSSDTRAAIGVCTSGTVMQADRGCDLDFLVGQSAPVRAGITHG